ncbi:hypothetical protein [Dactylococcopsis salina]|uniref:hypothetical protein n=1 Tax=Dactylococcopsis salina TaxID=292566 RepID=UPI0012EA76B2|nr:hypothetical protein [Dactylococcopsis salina]
MEATKPNTNIRYSLFVIRYLFTDYWSLGDVPWNVSTLVTVKGWVEATKPNLESVARIPPNIKFG